MTMTMLVLSVLVAWSLALVITRPKAGPLSWLVAKVRGPDNGTSWYYLWGCNKCMSIYTGALMLTLATWCPAVVVSLAFIVLPYGVGVVEDAVRKVSNG